jgi:hypothetical protein
MTHDADVLGSLNLFHVDIKIHDTVSTLRATEMSVMEKLSGITFGFRGKRLILQTLSCNLQHATQADFQRDFQRALPLDTVL